MNKLGRITLVIILGLLGALIVFFGVVLLTQTQGWIAIGSAVAILLFGLSTLASAWAIARGERVRDSLYWLFLSLP